MHPPLSFPLEDPIPPLPPEDVLSEQGRHEAFQNITDSLVCILRGWAETNGLPEAGKPFTMTVTDPKWFSYAYHALQDASDYFALNANKHEPAKTTAVTSDEQPVADPGEPPEEDPEVWVVVCPMHNVSTMTDDAIFVTGNFTLTTDPFQAKWCTTQSEAHSFRMEATVALAAKKNLASAAKLTVIKAKVSDFLEKTK